MSRFVRGCEALPPRAVFQHWQYLQATFVDVVLCREKQSSELFFERGRSPPPQTVSQHRQIDTSISVDVVEW